MVFEILHRLIKLFLMKDPCKKCLVKACCLEKCDEIIYIENYIAPYNSLKEIKIIYSCILFCWLTDLIYIFAVITKLF